MNDLTGKNALVTGASRGIGRAIAERLAADGAAVAVHYGSNDTAAKETVEAIEGAGGSAYPVRADLGAADGVDELFTGLERALPGEALDILVNNAGIHLPGAIEQITPEALDHAIAVNVRAPFLIIQRALPLLRQGGRVINIGSANTRVAVPTEPAYALTKGALNALGLSLAAALGPRGITVNTVSPGTTETDMLAWLRHAPEVAAGVAASTALGRLGQPSDIADAVAFLASPDARWVTAQVIDVSGGLFLGPGAFQGA
ncbi:SDR family NAD(P)-dependent oxidoreductase [Amycolatopsis minnesotensis]|uniref:SDR family oxidoreductase n=1 Tax=Amycolatopsis minnesotensis TaxID=337894 RepID=A0ABN2SRG2_9PSEU